MRFPWFVLRGLFFVPSTLIGWLITLAMIAYCVYAFMEIDGRSHSVSDTLINFVFRLIIVGLVYTVIAWLTSRSTRKA